ncbi:MAG: hypothetical protein ACYTBJ_21570 [Planctomycetota bacterium]|jgi:hypothetical protein
MSSQEVLAKVAEAIQSRRWFITVSYQDKAKGAHDLQHYWSTNEYPKEDVPKTLDFIKDDFNAKEGMKWQ